MTSSESDHPLSADQVLQALVGLGAEPVVDPELRPAGPRPEDLPELLGALLATVETEIAARIHPAEDPPTGLPELIAGWNAMVGDDGLGLAVLANRLQRSALDTLQAESADEPEPSAMEAAGNAVVAAANLISAYLSMGDDREVRHSLDAAEGFLAEALAGLHDARSELTDDDR
ncbi:hypothetical protein [Streptomyces sp. NPDC047108]|uniref:hypothetical protein n=1 Tax=Streptomyces sp. NPDC047108 TaxID=3155025 RepID=UPI003403A8E2